MSRVRRATRALRKLESVALVLALMGCAASAATSGAGNPYRVRSFVEKGRLIDQVSVPGSPPPAIRVRSVAVPPTRMDAGVNVIANVPAFNWAYGCTPTASAMLMGYYDNLTYTNLYTGPANGGACPMGNVEIWGSGECPLSATHIGKDGRAIPGYVEDYYIALDNAELDPYLANGWTEHAAGDCTGDFLGTSQSKFGNVDGYTTFFYFQDGSPCSDYTGSEPDRRDGAHGLRLFVNARGYTTATNYSQYIYGYNGNTLGFTFADFKGEIDAGRPVLIHLVGHTMLGYGYNDDDSVVYLHDTWDSGDHSMTWGGIYDNKQHFAVTVLHLEEPRVQFKSAAYTVGENGTNVSVCVSRLGGSVGAASVSYATANGTAVAGSDYTARSGTFSWADGDAEDKCIIVPILDDSAIEGNETFTVALSGASGVPLGEPSTASVTITDWEPGTVQFKSATYTVREDGTNACLSVSRTGGSDGAASVTYSTANGTAAAGSDYTARSGTLTWAAGDTADKTFTVPISDDSAAESSETFTAVLSGANGAGLGTPATTAVTITDWEPGTLQFTSAEYLVQETGGSVRVSVSRAGGSDGGASVNYATANGTATAGPDYAAQSGTFTWAAGDAAVKTFDVAITDDSTVENDETFTANLSGALGARLGSPSTSTVTIDGPNDQTFGAALDTENLTWTTGGNADWFVQSVTSYNDWDAAQSGVIGDGQTTWIQTTITGPGTLYYWWKVASEANLDKLAFLYDGGELTAISGSTGWASKGYFLGTGTHTLRWAYTKNGSGASGTDCGWLDQVSWHTTNVELAPGAQYVVPAGGSYNINVTADTSWTATKDQPWVTLLTSSGSGNGAVAYSVAANASSVARTATITVTSEGTVRTCQITQVGTVDLGKALDNTNLVWITGGSTNWFEQSATTHDTVDAAQSGLLGDGQTAWVQTTITGPGTLGYWWKVSSEAGGDKLAFYFDGIEQAGSLSGTAGAWTQTGWLITAGTHTLRWAYVKNGSGAAGTDCGWLDQVTWFNLSPEAQAFDAAGGSSNLYVTADTSWTATKNQAWVTLGTMNGLGSGTIAYWVAPNASPIARTATITVTSAGFAKSVAITQAGVAESTTLSNALDSANLTWTTGGGTNWFGQSLTSHDGADAAQSAPIGNNQTNWLQATVTGPGTLAYWWKVSSETGNDKLLFYLNGSIQTGSISGTNNAWTRQVWNIPAGANTLRWGYAKNGSVSDGFDCGWLDQVTWLSVTPGTQTVGMVGGAYSLNVTADAAWTGTSGQPWVTLGATSGTGNGTVDYAVATNASSISRTALITVTSEGCTRTNVVAQAGVTSSTTLSNALDSASLIWTTGGGTNWFGQSLTSHDGADAAQSGPIGNNQTNWLQAAVTGPGTLGYWWKVSSEAGGDKLLFSLNGSIQTGALSGTADEWARQTWEIPAGSNSLRWAYAKNGSVSNGFDCGWLDQVTWFAVTPGTQTVAAAGGAYSAGVTADEAWTASSDQAWLALGSTSGLGRGTIAYTVAANASANVRVAALSVTSAGITRTNRVTQLGVTSSTTLSNALDTANLTWTTGGGTNWFGQAVTTHDGADAAQSGPIGNGQTNWLQTTVTGPGTLGYWWKASSEAGGDLLTFSRDGTAQPGALSGTANEWTRQVWEIPAGSHTLRWDYAKNDSGASGWDCGWLDQVIWFGTTPDTQTVGAVGGSYSVGVTADKPWKATADQVWVTLVSGTNGLANGTLSYKVATNAAAMARLATISVTNGVDRRTCTVAQAGVAESTTLSNALDNANLTWTTGGVTNWFGQSVTSHDGSDAAQSGFIGDGQTNWLQTTVTGPGTLGYWWKASSELNGDKLTFYRDGAAQPGPVSGTTGQWTRLVWSIPVGLHVLRWEYAKNGSGASGFDSGWLDQMAWFAVTPGTQTVAAVGGTNSLFVTADTTWTATKDQAWLTLGSTSGSGNKTVAYWATTNASPAARSAYIAVTSAGSTITNFITQAGAVSSSTLGEALDNTNLTWTTGGPTNWFGQAVTTHDGTDAAQSGIMGHLRTNWIQTSVTGPGSLKFWWKVSSQKTSDKLTFYRDGIAQPGAISGTTGTWTQPSFEIPAGTHTLRWEYGKNATISNEWDCGWVDQVSWFATTPPTQTVAAVGGPYNIGVTADTMWTGTADQAWITLSTTNGVGSGTLAYAVAPNCGTASRTGKIALRSAGSARTNVVVQAGVTASVTLSNALDNANMTWTTGGTTNWFGQTAMSHDGADAAQSGVIGHGKTNWVETTVTGPGTLGYWWRASSEAGGDKLLFYRNGIAQAGPVSGTTNVWTRQSWELPAGAHTLRWAYAKNSSVTNGWDCGWLDQVTWLTLSPATQSVAAAGGAYSVSLKADAAWLASADQQWVSLAATNGTGNGTLAYSVATNASPVARTAFITLTNGEDARTCTVAQAGITVSTTLSNALDSASLTWTTGGGASWFGQSVTSHDGEDAAQSGGVGHGQTSWLQTTITGPGTLNYWWKAGCEDAPGDDKDYLRLLLDGAEQSRIDGQTGWLYVTLPLTSGSRTLRWEFTKNGSVSAYPDCGWVDQVEWVPGALETAQGTPFQWLDQYGLVAGGNYEAADAADVDGDGFTAWQEYVAGSLPTNGDSFFCAYLSMPAGAPVLTWTPDLGTSRVYTVLGKPSLASPAWLAPTNAATRFYRVRVSKE